VVDLGQDIREVFDGSVRELVYEFGDDRDLDEKVRTSGQRETAAGGAPAAQGALSYAIFSYSTTKMSRLCLVKLFPILDPTLLGAGEIWVRGRGERLRMEYKSKL
jgi:hypothetical protein